MSATLILFPSALQTEPSNAHFAPVWWEALQQVQGFIVENVRASRRFLRALDPVFPIDDYTWIAQEADGSYDMPAIKKGWKEGKSWGLLSDAGYPAVGDPGADVVLAAHQLGLQVRVLPGSCSFLLALAGSGLGGQHFAFRGYVPIDGAIRKQTIKTWEAESRKQGQTQICMDTPYRNAALFTALLDNLEPTTKLCYALDLEGINEQIQTKTVGDWRKSSAYEWPKQPCVFIFVANK
jgi:16S rRNA (cytidine1402-2'-O)-methyltransferase